MKQFKTILKFELKNYFSNKVFVGVTLLLVVAIVAVMFFPRLNEIIKEESNVDKENLPVMVVAGNYSENAVSYFSSAFQNYKVIATNVSLDDLKNSIIEEKVNCAFVFENSLEYTYYVNNLSMYDTNTAFADEVIRTLYRIEMMLESGMSLEDAESTLNIEIKSNSITLGKDQTENYFYTYIMLMALYFVIILYGQMIATNVATEKSSRAMELLITSANPSSLMFGKVIASCLAGLTQIASIFGIALISYNINENYWADNMIIKSIFDMPTNLFIYLLIFFVLGFLIYAFMYSAVGSAASKLEDINTYVMPVTLLFVVGFMIVIINITSGTVDSTIMKICSHIPFTSSMAMFSRIAMSTVPIYEIIISIIILIISSVIIGIASKKIYRAGVLMYGKPPKIGTILKSLIKSK